MINTNDVMNYSFVQQAIKYHGSDLLAALQVEQGENFLLEMDVAKFPAENVIESSRVVSGERQKTLISFIAKKADMLFKKHIVDVLPSVNELDNKDFYAILPPLECFMNTSEEARRDHFFQTLSKGDVVVGTVSAKHTHGLIIALVCVSAGKTRAIHDLDIKCFCNTNQIPLVSNHEEPLETFEVGESIQGVVLDVLPDTRKIYISMKESALPPSIHGPFKLGLITEDDIPTHHKETVKYCGETYSRAIERTLGFMNPSTGSHLSAMMGLSSQDFPSLMRGLHGKVYPKEDYAPEIFKLQCGKWAYKSVEQGIQYFKSGNNVEAFQCLNKALQIDPRNVEALVARGALFANNNSYSRALEDFYKALDINPNHVNAGKYTVETLVAHGKQHEEQVRIEEAIKCFQKALSLNPSHTEAMHSLRSSQKKVEEQEKERTRQLELEVKKGVVTDESSDETTNKTSVTKERLKQLLNVEKDVSDVKKQCWPSSSSTSSLTSDSTPTTTSEIKLQNSGKKRQTESKRKSRIKEGSSNSTDEYSNDRSQSDFHRRNNGSYHRKRRRSSTSSSTSSESTRHQRKPPRSKGKRRRESSSSKTSSKARRHNSTPGDRRASIKRSAKKHGSKSRKSYTTSDSESSSNGSNHNGAKRRSSINVSSLSSLGLGSRSKQRSPSTENIRRRRSNDFKESLAKRSASRDHREKRKTVNLVSDESDFDVQCVGGKNRIVSQLATFSGGQQSSTSLVIAKDPNSTGKVERSLSNASIGSSVAVITPKTNVVSKGKVSGGTLKELELFMATLKAKKIAGNAK